jgi:hypothetical protein
VDNGDDDDEGLGVVGFLLLIFSYRSSTKFRFPRQAFMTLSMFQVASLLQNRPHHRADISVTFSSKSACDRRFDADS